MTDNKTAPVPAEGAAPSSDEREALRTRAEKAEKERDEYLTLAKQVRAEFENYQKRQQRELAQERRFAHGPVVLSLLSALDNLERALTEANKNGDKGPLVQGVAMVENQVLDILRRHGVTRMEALSQPFDANLHHAVMQMPTADRPPMTVLQVLEQGYMIHDRVLRPASVVVSVAPAEKSA
jgi:molecular chaperone GrpE